MARKYLTGGLIFLLALALTSCNASTGEPVAPAAAAEGPAAEPAVLPAAADEPSGELEVASTADEKEVTVSAADWVLSQGEWETFTTTDGLPNNRIRALLIDADGHLWVGASQGGGWFDGTTWKGIVAFPAGVRDMAVDDQGRVWLADGFGVEVYEHGTMTTYGLQEGLISLLTEAILVDREGTVWASAIMGDHPGGCADSVAAGGINLFDGEEWSLVDTSDLFSPTVLDLVEDASGNIWAVGGGGFARFDGTTWEPMRLPDEQANDEQAADEQSSEIINCVAADSTDRIWLGTKGLGIWIWDGQGWSQYTRADGLAADTVWAIAFDDAGRAWVGTSGGLNVLDGESWTTYTVADGLAYNDVRAFAFVEDGVWIGTWKGLNHLVFAASE